MSIKSNQIFFSFAILLSIDKVLSDNNQNDLQLDQIVNLKNSGGIGCVLAVHNEVQKCKANYVQKVSAVVESGSTMDSEEYRKAFCCGFWSLRDCVADSAKQKCDTKTARTIANMKIYGSEHENVFYTKCDRFDYGSRQCGSASIQSISLFTLIIAFSIQLLIRQ